MCTVSFVPTVGGEYILTTNRDEQPKRLAHLPEIYNFNDNLKAIYPKDSLKERTWVAIGNNTMTVCLLNGAFKKHKHNPPYKYSRGQIPLQLLSVSSVDKFVKNSELENIEPFTLIIVQKKALYAFRWDGHQKHLKNLDNTKPYIWASSTLYSDKIIAKKQSLFEHFLSENSQPKQSDILYFHGLDNPLNGQLLDLPNVKTTSITSIKSSEKQLSMFYHDMVQNKETLHHLSIQK